MNLLTALVAMLVERMFGYPKFLQRTLHHPVQWMGAFIDFCDHKFNDDHHAGDYRRTMGAVTVLALCLLTAAVTITIKILLAGIPYGWVIEALLASAFLSAKQLAEMVANVADTLVGSLERAREVVSHIVGRDTSRLEMQGVSRAAIETLAENASDGVFAPIFYLALFGLPGIAIYKAINTADSMIGHLDERYAVFGWASAKLDDIINWVPARLTALLMAIAAIVFPGASMPRALATAWRDARKHKSPNAGWPEAALAGALGFGLGGPRDYEGKTLDLPQMGSGKRNLSPADIRRAVSFFWATWLAGLAVLGLLALKAFAII